MWLMDCDVGFHVTTVILLPVLYKMWI